jgi:hypothetical protein
MGRFFAVALQKKLKVFEAPPRFKAFVPLVLHKKIANYHAEDIVRVVWSRDSRFLITCCKDRNVRIFSLHKIKGFIPFTLTGHKATPILAAFTQQHVHAFSLGKDGFMCIWKWVQEVSEGFRRQQEFQLQKFGRKLKVLSDSSNEEEEDMSRFSDFERQVTSGRFILEKKQRYELSGAKVFLSPLHT